METNKRAKSKVSHILNYVQRQGYIFVAGAGCQVQLVENACNFRANALLRFRRVLWLLFDFLVRQWQHHHVLSELLHVQ